MELFIEHFEMGEVLGAGQYGSVALARLKNNKDIKFAIKTMKLDSSKEEKHNLQLLLEIQIHKRVSECPYIVKCYGHFLNEGNINLVLEYVEGGTLYELMMRQKFNRFREPTAAKFILQIVGAVQHIHNCLYMHGDLKPENILITNIGNIKLSDFGLAWPMYSGKERGFCGTPEYMAPEIVDEDPYDYRVDFWSIGVLIFELLVGRSPFKSKKKTNTFLKIRNVDLKFPRILSEDAIDLISHLIVKDPKKRISLKKILLHRWTLLNSNTKEHKPQ